MALYNGLGAIDGSVAFCYFSAKALMGVAGRVGTLPLPPGARLSWSCGQWPNAINQAARLIGGGFHEPLRNEIGPSFGQYKRNITLNFPFGAGSQFASLSAPGEAAWR